MSISRIAVLVWKELIELRQDRDLFAIVIAAPILQLFMYKQSGSLTGPADVNTGLKFLDKTTVAPYNNTKSRYEGSSTSSPARSKWIPTWSAAAPGLRWPSRPATGKDSSRRCRRRCR